tara:strand:- start:12 stop:854 length:843 start_codon:yes stop_codon:yes gene_type:complete
MRFKHNKKRNTAFLYESLLKEMSKAVVRGDDNKRIVVMTILKDFFSPGKVLREELALYKFLYETKKVDLYTAERIIQEARKDYESLDLKQIFNEQTRLINVINKKLGSDMFSTFVPNYRSLATISQIFNTKMAAKSRVLLERKIMSVMVEKEQAPVKMTNMPALDKLTYKTFVDKFNDKYGSELLKEQKDLLTRYILSLTDNGVSLKIYLNEEISRLKSELNSAVKAEKYKNDEMITEKISDVASLLESFSKRKVDGMVIEKILRVQSFVEEMNKDGDQD